MKTVALMNSLCLFFFNDAIQLAGDWRVALSEIIFLSEHIVNGDMGVYSLKGRKRARKGLLRPI